MTCRKCKQTVPDGMYCLACGTRQELEHAKKRRGNGQGCAYKRGKTWTVKVENHNNGIRSIRTKGGFPTKTAALAFIPQLLVKNTKGITTLNKLYEGWSTSALLKLSSSKQVAYKIAYEKLKPIVHSDITILSIMELQKVIDDAASSYYTARDMKVLLSHLYKRACAEEVVKSNLATYITLPELIEEEPVPFCDGELSALWTHYKDDTFIGYILLMIYSGMMPGELLKCEKSMIDLDRQTILGCGIKTKKRKQTPIVLADIIIPVVRDLLEHSPTDKLLNMKKNDFYDRFDLTLRNCGCRDLTPYSCRHTTATALARGADIAPSIIQEVMRHAKFSTTERYIHMTADDALNAVNKISTTNKLSTSIEKS